MSSFERTWERIVLGGALLIAVGSIPRWFTLSIDSSLADATGAPREAVRGGLAGDGLLTLALAVVAVGLLLRGRGSGSWKTGALVSLCGAVTALIAAVTYRDAATFGSQFRAIDPGGFTLEVEPWLWVVLVGGVVLAAAGAFGAYRRRGPA